MLWATTLTAAALGLVAGQEQVARRGCYHHATNGGSIYDYEESDIMETKNISMQDYRGKVVLIVNVATYWGYARQYPDMNALQESYSDFVVLGFPCNIFGKQQPEANGTEILNGIKYVRPGNGYEPNFPIFKKIEVNGENEHPMYTYLKNYCPSTREHFSDANRLFYSPIKNSDIRWNWEKFLISKEGKPYMRYDAGTKPDDIRSDIEFLLKQPLRNVTSTVSAIKG